MWRHDSGMKMCYVYDISHKHYREKIQYSFPFVEEMVTALKVGDYDTAFRVLIENRSQEADICCQFLLKYILYSLKTAELVGYSIHSADDVMAAGFNWCPPLAMVEAFSGKKQLKKLCENRIESSVLEQSDFEQLLDKIEKSKYDFRKYIKAKK